MIGTIKWFDATKGYGFIRGNSGAPDIFIHFSALKRARIDTLEAGDRVEFEIAADRKTGKPVADALKVLPPVAQAS